MSAIRLAVVGASGRMGRAVVRLAVERGDRVVAAVAANDVGHDAGELSGVGRLGVAVTDDLTSLEKSGAQVAVDFSVPSATRALLEVAARAGIAIVSGTTGLDAAGKDAVDRAAQRIAVLWEPNMSLGVHVLGELVRQAIVALGAGYDLEIVEAHHRRKVDAPSGTALRLAEIAAGARGDAPIGMHALRGGDVVGDHTVHLLGAGERLELTHRATSRDLFAHGALRAASWIAGRPAGRYRLGDVLRRD